MACLKKMSVSEDKFWDVQSIWTRVKDTPTALGLTGNARGVASDASNPVAAPPDGDLGEKLLKLVAKRGSVDSYELSQELGVDHQQVVGSIKSLQSLGEVRS